MGGLALALGGIFLVRYSIEQGWIGPGVRITLGALLGGVLVSAGEWLRRRENIAGIAGLPSAHIHIPSILTAAGTTVCYATVFAAYVLYDFIGPAAAFALLGVVALATLTAALLHGPALAALGVVGAQVTPLLVETGAPNYWALYIYLAVVTAAAFVLARLRLWRWLAVTAVAFGVFWALPGLHNAAAGTVAPHIFHVVAGFVLAAFIIVAGLFFGPEAAPAASMFCHRERSRSTCSWPRCLSSPAIMTRRLSCHSCSSSPRRWRSHGAAMRPRRRCRRARCFRPW